MIDEYGAFGGIKNWQGKPNYFEKISPSAALATSLNGENEAGKLLYGERMSDYNNHMRECCWQSPPTDDLAKRNMKTQLMD
jgi:hypothetical protein